ncbi:hypothetical protein UFOVP964_87 [uncultured Caudovirales phage]|uniref:Uncharacterized protein n=1 Tax=uncultured Caudovirales phage TaxID=2100421 RepID=A0A6J5RI16_9CAUD|nr:hypothetical protein UFOVP854_87 [uncultured Caudovirales phage]CAB4174811.1 hypothetical protein UFOVP964_87 [uncultured Caudovirales phage]CAB4179330.1 hypothetical protein UFOVP1034_71 [uncultured Caudovirales phage]CAB4189115.1 hypothetical protein UFOVP1177_71 [uncultured Caudovirales phage]CAB4193318.1 hypothetical protein UFOVP1243_58 [uncultured Caudovirales phage]
MGDIYARRLTPQDELWVCDSCNQEGVRANGKDITSHKEVVMWFCYNCVQKILEP